MFFLCGVIINPWESAPKIHFIFHSYLPFFFLCHRPYSLTFPIPSYAIRYVKGAAIRHPKISILITFLTFSFSCFTDSNNRHFTQCRTS